MGGCCTRNEEINFDKNTSFKYPVEETNSIMHLSTKPELKFEQNNLQLNEEDVELSKIIHKLQINSNHTFFAKIQKKNIIIHNYIYKFLLVLFFLSIFATCNQYFGLYLF